MFSPPIAISYQAPFADLLTTDHTDHTDLQPGITASLSRTPTASQADVERLRRAKRGRKCGDTGLASAEKRQKALASPASTHFQAPASGRRATARYPCDPW